MSDSVSSSRSDVRSASSLSGSTTTLRSRWKFRRLFDAVKASDVVITMGCGDACPILPGKRYEDWKLDDPAGQGIDAVRVT
ncbi:hypothetical protein GCM10027161_32670 [Microbispora hainanensis]